MAHLKKIHDGYSNEVNEPNDTDRKGLFGNLEAALKKHLAIMEQLKPSTQHLPNGRSIIPPTNKPVVSSVVNGPGRVANLVNFHNKQISSVNAIDKKGALIVKLRQWLYRQGATVSPNGSIVWSKSAATIKYDTELAQQELTRITLQNGLLYDSKNVPLDTRQMVTAASGPGWCIYVMSAENNIHVSSHSVGARHHSSLLAGGNVACAGEMQVHDGKLITLSNKSGHYTPEPVYLTQVIRALSEANVDENSYTIKEYRANEKPIMHESAGSFMDLQRCPVWPFNDINEILVENPNYAASLLMSVYGSEYTGSNNNGSDLVYGVAHSSGNSASTHIYFLPYP
jgi:hypothetical protein